MFDLCQREKRSKSLTLLKLERKQEDQLQNDSLKRQSENMQMKEFIQTPSTPPAQTLFKQQKEIAEQNLKVLKEAGKTQSSSDNKLNASKTGGKVYNPTIGQFQNRETESMR